LIDGDPLRGFSLRRLYESDDLLLWAPGHFDFQLRHQPGERLCREAEVSRKFLSRMMQQIGPMLDRVRMDWLASQSVGTANRRNQVSFGAAV
jgi:hypothetical protein